jgi:hypothetical protein
MPAAYEYWEHRGQYRLWAAMLLGPSAWALNELIGYALVKPVCAGGQKILVLGLSAAMLLLALGGLWIGWSCLAELRGARQKGGTRLDRSYFMALVAIGFNALLALLVVTQAVAPFLLNPCE